MKKFASFYLILCAIFTVSAQKDFQGMAVYQSKTSVPDFKPRGGREITPEMQKAFEERMKKMLEKTFILNFDKSASTYKEEEKLDTPGQQGGGGMRMFASFTGGGGTYYKNVKDKIYTVDKEFMGKEFLVKDSLPKLDWKMTGETKVIGGYTCYKATAVKAIQATDFRNLRPKKEEEKKPDAKEEVKADATKSTNFMDNFEMPKEVTVTAWYTPEIPVNQGPEGYWGLPGLILEVSDDRTVILCSKVVLNPKDKVEIKAVKNGKEITQKDYDKVVMEKMKELQQSGGPGGPGGRMRFGN